MLDCSAALNGINLLRKGEYIMAKRKRDHYYLPPQDADKCKAYHDDPRWAKVSELTHQTLPNFEGANNIVLAIMRDHGCI